ncbi:sensor histidine kinase [Roseburia sp. 499]|uniref:sensor histidine kinase n=1 Tax=Roseburia sp. 499 TaxID=1261634 RepID=UPI0009513D64|nr:HAMP domain-containing sensor histidine kinase [Roseburia sp. 499]WVK68804.1 HAMP domain-containing sensor histidine kinase [Roseburia sp. 499]
MKKFRGIWLLLIGITILVFAGANIIVWNQKTGESGRTYRVEINRVCHELEEGNGNVSLEKYSEIKSIAMLPAEATQVQLDAFFQGEDEDYVIRRINGVYYRIEYEAEEVTERNVFWTMNLGLSIMAVAMFGLTVYIRHNLIKPFQRISEVPYELSKGNLTAGVKENRNRYFGKFVWGLDLLREKLEDERKKELDLQKEKQTLILSISHDIKTPLSAIKLYAKALERNLYDTREKQTQIAENINKKADEIEGFVCEIVKASNEDFLNLEVKREEFYLQELVDEIKGYYVEKLEILRIPFSCKMEGNCLVKGDLERAVEVIQNIMENAIKYGDGGYISIEMAEEEDCRLFTVKNSGCTLKQEEIPHIFDSFWRGSNTGSQLGSGLGLYICRQLMQKMDGEIYAGEKEGEMQVTVVFRMA